MKNFNYVQSQLDKIYIGSVILNVKMTDYEGSETKNFGVNDVEAIDTLIKFLEERKRLLNENNS